MSASNPWFLITAEEIDAIRNGLKDVGDCPATRGRISEILSVIDRVQGRRP